MPDRTRTDAVFPSFKARLYLLLLAAVAGFAVVKSNPVQLEESLGLDNVDRVEHAFSRLSISTPAIFIGSSVVASVSNQMNTVLGSDVTVDLASNRGNILASMAYVALSSRYHPGLVILGLSRDDYFRVNLLSSAVVTQRTDLFERYVPNEVLGRLRGAKEDMRISLVPRLFQLLLFLPMDPHPFGGAIERLRKRLYSRELAGIKPARADPYLDPSLEEAATIDLDMLKGPLLRGLKRLVEDGGSRLVVFLAPHKPEHGPAATAAHQEILRILKDDGILYFDYFDSLSQRTELFKDEFHLDLEGRTISAKQFAADLRASLCSAVRNGQGAAAECAWLGR